MLGKNKRIDSIDTTSFIAPNAYPGNNVSNPKKADELTWVWCDHCNRPSPT